MTGFRGPDTHPWTLAVVRQTTRFEPIGTAVAIERRLALTCAHVVLDHFDEPGAMTVREPLWVAFPQVTSAWKQRRLVGRVEFDADDPQTADIALLHLVEDMPAGVTPARLRLLQPAALPGRRWWAFGFPVSSLRNGNEASGVVGAALANGWVRLDTESRFPVEQGFSGGGLWLPEYQAVTGIVGRALLDGRQRGDAQALTLAQADVCLPDAKLRVVAGWSGPDAGASAMAAWGWQLDNDPEAGRHWRPRGRGVMSEHEPGYRFAGRTAALHRIVGLLDGPAPDRRVLVVTGSPGVGKSAVLGRIVTTADRHLRRQLPGTDQGVRASEGSVGCAVHVRGKTALDVAREIARAVGVALPEQVEELTAPLRARLEAEPGRRLNVVIDAVDEASSPAEARLVLAAVVLPLVQTCWAAGVQVVCGTRRTDAAGDLLGVLGGAGLLLDLDDPAYFELADLENYTLASLRLVGGERPGNPYDDPAVARPVAARIAVLADRNFLVAGLEARRRGQYDDAPADPAGVSLTATVDATLHAYLDRVPAVDGVPARDVLTALAYAEAPGWSSRLWHAATVALGAPVSEPHLDRFARTAAASFLVETVTASTQTSAFRLFHQAVNDALLRPRGRGGVPADEGRLTRALHALGRETGWAGAEPYLLRSLAGHADRAGIIDSLLADDDYLLHAELLRLLSAANHATSEPARRRARLMHLTLSAVSARPAERAAMFSITQVLEQLPPIAPDAPAPYRGRWAATRPRIELRQLTGHTSWVSSVCAATVDGRTVLATGSGDATVRVWDPATGTELRRLTGHTGAVAAVCTVDVHGRTLLATGGHDGTARVWDPFTGTELRRLTGHDNGVTAVCAVVVDGRALLATGSTDATVRVWDAATGTQLCRLTNHTSWVVAVCAVVVDGRVLLATGSADATVRLWDPATGTQLRRITGHVSGISAMCAIEVGGRTLLATASTDATVRLWDPGTGREVRRFTAPSLSCMCAVVAGGSTLLATSHYDASVVVRDPATGRELRRLTGHTSAVSAVAAADVDGRVLLATGSHDETARVWDPATGAGPRQLIGHTSWVVAVCAVAVDGRVLLATGSHDETARVWDPVTGTELRQLIGHARGINAVCAITVGGRTLLATGSTDATARLWDLATGAEVRRLTGHGSGINAVCAVEVDGRTLLATGSTDATVRLWDPATGAEIRRLAGHASTINTACVIEAGGRPLLATGSTDATARLWDPATGAEVHRLTGHTSWVNAVCAVRVGRRTLLATASTDATARLWDPVTGAEVRRLTGHTSGVTGVCAIERNGRVLLATGGHDATVRICDPATGQTVSVIGVQHSVTDCGPVDGALAIALEPGILVVDLSL